MSPNYAVDRHAERPDDDFERLMREFADWLYREAMRMHAEHERELEATVQWIQLAGGAFVRPERPACPPARFADTIEP